ncbi:hypothetical protein LINPERHAP1_LOCUS21431 [Linum perenne]
MPIIELIISFWFEFFGLLLDHSVMFKRRSIIFGNVKGLSEIFMNVLACMPSSFQLLIRKNGFVITNLGLMD